MSSNEFSQFTGISMLSLFENNKNVGEINIHYFDCGLNEENKAKTIEVAKRYGRNLTFYSAEDCFNDLCTFVPIKERGVAGYLFLKVFLERYLPSLNKVLFLDSDTIVSGDLTELYNTDITNHYFAVVPDVMAYNVIPKPEDKNIVNKNTMYFNTGVVLFNLARIRKYSFSEVLKKSYIRYTEAGGVLAYPEQSLLNRSVDDTHYIPLHFRFNYYGHQKRRRDRDRILGAATKRWNGRFDKQERTEAGKSPVVIHYFGANRPWYKWTNCSKVHVYNKYWKKSPWRDVKKQSYAPIVQKDWIKKNPKTVVGKRGIGIQLMKMFLVFDKLAPRWMWRAFWATSRLNGRVKQRFALFKRMLSKQKRKITARNLKQRMDLFFYKTAAIFPWTYQHKNMAKLKALKDSRKGERCFIVGMGPSLTMEDLELLKGETTFSLNSVFRLFDHTDWRPTYYYLQDIQLETYGEAMFNELYSKIVDSQFTNSFIAHSRYDKKMIHRESIINVPVLIDWANDFVHRMPKFSKDCSKYIYGYATSVYSIVQLIRYMGFSELYLIGVDCNYSPQAAHCYNENGFDKDFFSQNVCNQLNRTMYLSYTYLKKLLVNMPEIKIYNATRGGKLEEFPRVKLEDIL